MLEFVFLQKVGGELYYIISGQVTAVSQSRKIRITSQTYFISNIVTSFTVISLFFCIKFKILSCIKTLKRLTQRLFELFNSHTCNSHVNHLNSERLLDFVSHNNKIPRVNSNDTRKTFRNFFKANN